MVESEVVDTPMTDAQQEEQKTPENALLDSIAKKGSNSVSLFSFHASRRHRQGRFWQDLVSEQPENSRSFHLHVSNSSVVVLLCTRTEELLNRRSKALQRGRKDLRR